MEAPRKEVGPPKAAYFAWIGVSTTAGAGVTATLAADPGPTRLVARTRTVYGVSLVSPDTVPVSLPSASGPVVRSACQVVPPSVEDSKLAGAPPSEPGVKVSVALPLPGVAVRPVGGAGTVAAGVTATLAADPGPTRLVARTRTVYGVSWVSPDTVPVSLPSASGPVVGSACQVMPPSVEDSKLAGAPPSEPGVKVSAALPLPGVAVRPVGGAGTVAAGVTATLAADPGPTRLVARTRTVYGV